MASNNAYGPQIVTDGLVCCLDANNTKSYPGAGTTWYDLSPGGNTAYLQNNATFEQEGIIKSIFADGTDDGVQVDSDQLDAVFATSGVTVEVVFKMDSSQSNPYPRIWDKGYCLMHSTQTSPFGIYVNIYDDDLDILQIGASNFNVTDEWVHATWSWDGRTSRIWKNSERTTDNTSASQGDIKATLTTMKIMTNSFSSSTRDTAGNVALFRVYERALTKAEVKQNYNAHRARFGL